MCTEGSVTKDQSRWCFTAKLWVPATTVHFPACLFSDYPSETTIIVSIDDWQCRPQGHNVQVNNENGNSHTCNTLCWNCNLEDLKCWVSEAKKDSKKAVNNDLPWDDEIRPASQSDQHSNCFKSNIGTVSRATLGKPLEDGVDGIFWHSRAVNWLRYDLEL